jgi:protease IV
MAASGGYYIAAACENIYAYRASLVGSIGVIYSSFGLEHAIEKLGISRRLMTAGENKGILDPFSPETAEGKAHVQHMLDQIHQVFIADVKKGRGNRLQATADIFSGLFWSGDKAKELGLIDGFSSRSMVAKTVIGHKTIVDYSPAFDPFAKLLKVSETMVGLVQSWRLQ